MLGGRHVKCYSFRQRKISFIKINTNLVKLKMAKEAGPFSKDFPQWFFFSFPQSHLTFFSPIVKGLVRRLFNHRNECWLLTFAFRLWADVFREISTEEHDTQHIILDRGWVERNHHRGLVGDLECKNSLGLKCRNRMLYMVDRCCFVSPRNTSNYLILIHT